MNAVCFFAREHSKRIGRPAFQTYVYKYLALFDFKVLELEGLPALDIKYNAMEMGPVPLGLYSEKQDTSHYRFLPIRNAKGEEKTIVDPLIEPNLDYFSEDEISIMKSILDEFAHPGASTEALIDATHERIQAWKKAWARRGMAKSVPMSYSDTFDTDEQTEVYEHFLTYKALQRVPRRRHSMGQL